MVGLETLLSTVSSPVELRLLAEYGAMFLTAATPPPVVVFSGEAEVKAFQDSLEIGRAVLGEHEIELQQHALGALIAASVDTMRAGANVGARAADSGRRSFNDTVKLWLRNVNRGLDHWQASGSIAERTASRIRALSAIDQVPVILDLEATQQIYFGTYFNRSILYSVAAPGASQHLSMLAFDVAQYQEEAVETALASHGWYRTVINDLPHFTFLGQEEKRLPEIGLKRVVREEAGRLYHFWVLDL